MTFFADICWVSSIACAFLLIALGAVFVGGKLIGTLMLLLSPLT